MLNPFLYQKKKDSKKKKKIEKGKIRQSVSPYPDNQPKLFENSNASEKIAQEITEVPKEPPPQISQKQIPIPKRTRSEIPIIPANKKKLHIDNNTVQLLINSIDQKFSSCSFDSDFPIVIDTMINASADLTLAKCEDADKSLIKVSQVTESVESMSEQLENQANEMSAQAKLTLSEMKSLEGLINDVLYPKTSFFVKIVSSILFIITSLLHLFQMGIEKIDGNPNSDDENSQSDN
ncbi:hypothetical protein M9Y10_005424 [Tritrichomonas musculus]|uniref:Uncharacterized protein n=1 Tax=Tritrichomonas musculus TaxID=1915356 RepID=A0ABR2JL39_9EUKA